MRSRDQCTTGGIDGGGPPRPGPPLGEDWLAAGEGLGESLWAGESVGVGDGLAVGDGLGVGESLGLGEGLVLALGEALGLGESLGEPGEPDGPDEADAVGEAEAEGEPDGLGEPEAEAEGEPPGIDGEAPIGGPGSSSVGDGGTGTPGVDDEPSRGAGAVGDGALDPKGTPGTVGAAVPPTVGRVDEGTGVAVACASGDGMGERPGVPLGPGGPERGVTGGPSWTPSGDDVGDAVGVVEGVSHGRSARRVVIHACASVLGRKPTRGHLHPWSYDYRS
jgi:hypothetical protein